MLVLTGPSASGKTELMKILVSKYKMKKMVTYTTREMRVGEVNGTDYHFVSTKDFLSLKDKNEFIETINYNNNYYGTRKSDFEDYKIVVLDPNGVNTFYEFFKDKIIVIYLESPKPTRSIRMINRLDPDEVIKKRLLKDDEIFKISNYKKIDVILENDEIDLAKLADKIYNVYRGYKETVTAR